VRRVLLLILDGAGYSADPRGNAITPATMPALFGAMAEQGFAVLAASGPAVGLEPDQVGNSESGHMTIGAGRVVPAMSMRIAGAFESGAWSRSPVWRRAYLGRRLHIAGLLSGAGVHAFARTLWQAATIAARDHELEVIVHPILDGVDSPAGSAPSLLDELRRKIAGLPSVSLGVIMGRRWFCDRSGKLEITRVAVDALAGLTPLPAFADDVLAHHLRGAGEASFAAHLVAGGQALAPGETVLMTSHRADRARQVIAELARRNDVLTLVDPGLASTSSDNVFFPEAPLTRGLAQELKAAGLSSRRISEKCKHPHVTYFFDGFDQDGEGQRTCVDSIPESEIAARPEMSLAGVLEAIDAALASRGPALVVANLANLDQVGHLGRLDLAEQAARAVDRAFARLAAGCRKHGWTLIATADHGNADRVVDDDGAPFGSHTDRPVPLVVLPAGGARPRWRAHSGSLANVAATCATALGLEAPDWMERSLIEPDYQ